jgi:uncharacterized SAM-binding protein YcdF (DUF218 family)
MREHGWRTAILVTEPHHIKRALVIARDAGPGWHTPDAARHNLLGDARALMLYQLRRLRRGLP